MNITKSMLIITLFAAIIVITTPFVSSAQADEWEFVLLWQQLVEDGVAAVSAGDLKGGTAPEIAIATWKNDVRILSCTGERDTSFSAPPLRGNVTLLAIGRGLKENYVAAAGLWQPFVAAYAPDGRRLWEYEDLKGAGVAGIATVRSGAFDHVAVAYADKPGVRVLDEKGGVVCTTPSVGISLFVAGLDSDSSGKEEVLSNPEKLTDPAKATLVYYNLSGKAVRSVPFPGHTSLAITADVDNDGKKDIVSYYGTDSVTLGVWSRSGRQVWSTKLEGLPAPSALVAADFNGDKEKEVVAAFPQGEILVFKNGKKVAGVQAQQRYPRIAAADVDSDGKAELLVGDGKGLRAFKLGPKVSKEEITYSAEAPLPINN